MLVIREALLLHIQIIQDTYSLLPVTIMEVTHIDTMPVVIPDLDQYSLRMRL
jgi:hypothetical protein